MEIAAHGGDSARRRPQEEVTLRVRAVVDHRLHPLFFGQFEDPARAFERKKAPSQDRTLEPATNDGAAVRDREGLGAERLEVSANGGEPAAGDQGDDDSFADGGVDRSKVRFGDLPFAVQERAVEIQGEESIPRQDALTARTERSPRPRSSPLR